MSAPNDNHHDGQAPPGPVQQIATGGVPFADPGRVRRKTARTISTPTGEENVWVEQVTGYHFIVDKDNVDLQHKKALILSGVGYAIIDLELEDTVFINDPIQWFRRDPETGVPRPMATPPGIRIHRINEKRTVVFSENFSPHINEFHFWIVVFDEKTGHVRDIDPGVIFEPYEPPTRR